MGVSKPKLCTRFEVAYDVQLQSIVSKFCGHFCIYFCIRRSSGLHMHKIVRSLSSDTGLNDVLVHSYVCRRE